MENKINIAEILKNCPKGMELDCTIFNDVTLYRIDTSSENEYPIRIETKNGNFLDLTKYGTYSNVEESKCVIFPKGKTTWVGFVPPCKFKDGDVVAGENCVCSYITIFRKFIDDTSFSHHVCLTSFGNFKVDDISDNANLRLATEEEKQKLFQTIKNNGYKWNAETKTLETLTPNKFDITALKPFDKVLMRSSNAREWVGTFYSHYSNNKFYGCGMCCDQCIPYEGNEHLLGTTNDCDDFYKNW